MSSCEAADGGSSSKKCHLWLLWICAWTFIQRDNHSLQVRGSVLWYWSVLRYHWLKSPPMVGKISHLCIKPTARSTSSLRRTVLYPFLVFRTTFICDDDGALFCVQVRWLLDPLKIISEMSQRHISPGSRIIFFKIGLRNSKKPQHFYRSGFISLIKFAQLFFLCSKITKLHFEKEETDMLAKHQN